jgi:chloride channel protein, CIC family
LHTTIGSLRKSLREGELRRLLSRARLRLLQGLLHLNLSQDINFLLISIVVGVAAGFGAVIFHEAVWLVQDFFFVHVRSLFGTAPWAPYAVVLFPAAGGLLVGVISRFISSDARGHGVPEVIKAVIAKGGHLRSSLMVSKTVTSALSIGSGGGAGREGPIIMIGAAAGSAVGQFFKLSSDQLRALVAAGAAGGIAAIFNAPLGGVMFAIEIILGDFSVRSFSPIVVSAVVATAISRTFLGNHPTFVATDYQLVSNYELLFYLGIGLLAGVVSVWFVKMLFSVEDFFGKLRRVPSFLRPALGGLGVGVMLIWLPELAGYSYDVNNRAILGQADILLLGFVFLLKPVACGLTLGSGGSGGVFAPALKAGAAFGGVVGFFLHMLFPSVTASSGAYALVGMGALVAGTMHAPLTAMVIIFEISNTYQVILPIMFAAISASVVARVLMKHSVYTMPLAREGIEIGYGINLSIVHRITVQDLVQEKAICVRQTTPIQQIITHVQNSDQTIFPVTDEAGRLVGLVRFHDLRQVLTERELPAYLMADDIMIRDFPILSVDDRLDTVLKTFELEDADALPVVRDLEKRTLLGIVLHEDVLRRYRKEILLRSER